MAKADQQSMPEVVLVSLHDAFFYKTRVHKSFISKDILIYVRLCHQRRIYMISPLAWDSKQGSSLYIPKINMLNNVCMK